MLSDIVLSIHIKYFIGKECMIEFYSFRLTYFQYFVLAIKCKLGNRSSKQNCECVDLGCPKWYMRSPNIFDPDFKEACTSVLNYEIADFAYNKI